MLEETTYVNNVNAETVTGVGERIQIGSRAPGTRMLIGWAKVGWGQLMADANMLQTVQGCTWFIHVPFLAENSQAAALTQQWVVSSALLKSPSLHAQSLILCVIVQEAANGDGYKHMRVYCSTGV
jgi:hypothetical protein